MGVNLLDRLRSFVLGERLNKNAQLLSLYHQYMKSTAAIPPVTHETPRLGSAALAYRARQQQRQAQEQAAKPTGMLQNMRVRYAQDNSFADVSSASNNTANKSNVRPPLD